MRIDVCADLQNWLRLKKRDLSSILERLRIPWMYLMGHGWPVVAKKYWIDRSTNSQVRLVNIAAFQQFAYLRSALYHTRPLATTSRDLYLMTQLIKTPEQIIKMRLAGQLAAEVLEMIGDYVKPGVSTAELDRICHDYIVNHQKAIPACLGYKGYPKTICTSVNHVVCHGIPSEDKILKKGDIVVLVAFGGGLTWGSSLIRW